MHSEEENQSSSLQRVRFQRCAKRNFTQMQKIQQSSETK